MDQPDFHLGAAPKLAAPADRFPPSQLFERAFEPAPFWF
jgi:hypothetical protein